MPDLLTHSLVITPFKKRLGKNFVLVLVGAILPDIVGRIPGVIFPNRTSVNWMLSAFHSPAALILVCLLFSFFFSQQIRKRAFFSLLEGVFLHLFLDLFQKTLTVGYFWFFPFSFKSFWIPLFWPNDSIFLIPPLILLNLVIFRRSIKNLLVKK